MNVERDLIRDLDEHRGRIYRHVNGRVTCPKCKQAGVHLNELVMVSQIPVMIPKVKGCPACGGEPESTVKGFCSLCQDKGWVVVGQDHTHANYVCASCASEMRGGTAASLVGRMVYTTSSRAGESPPRSASAASRATLNDSSARLRPMCLDCQMNYAVVGTRCRRCERVHLDDDARELNMVRARLEVLGESHE